MAKRVLTVDDIDGSEDATTTTFGFDGQMFEIDLAQKNLTKLRSVLTPFMESGRRTGRTSMTPKSNNGKPQSMATEQLNAIRDWARKNGYPNVSDKGRIPGEVLLAFEAAQATPEPKSPPVKKVEPPVT